MPVDCQGLDMSSCSLPTVLIILANCGLRASKVIMHSDTKRSVCAAKLYCLEDATDIVYLCFEKYQEHALEACKPITYF